MFFYIISSVWLHPWGHLGAVQCTHQNLLESTRTVSSDGVVSLLGGVIKLPPGYNRNVEPPGDPSFVDIGFLVSDIMDVDDSEYKISIKVSIKVILKALFSSINFMFSIFKQILD